MSACPVCGLCGLVNLVGRVGVPSAAAQKEGARPCVSRDSKVAPAGGGQDPGGVALVRLHHPVVDPLRRARLSRCIDDACFLIVRVEDDLLTVGHISRHRGGGIGGRGKPNSEWKAQARLGVEADSNTLVSSM
jgi:hypothetical protein